MTLKHYLKKDIMAQLLVRVRGYLPACVYNTEIHMHACKHKGYTY